MNKVLLLDVLLVEVLLHREDGPVLPDVLHLDGAEIGHPLVQSVQDRHLDVASVEEVGEIGVVELQRSVFGLKLGSELRPDFGHLHTEFSS